MWQEAAHGNHVVSKHLRGLYSPLPGQVPLGCTSGTTKLERLKPFIPSPRIGEGVSDVLGFGYLR